MTPAQQRSAIEDLLSISNSSTDSVPIPEAPSSNQNLTSVSARRLGLGLACLALLIVSLDLITLGLGLGGWLQLLPTAPLACTILLWLDVAATIVKWVFWLNMICGTSNHDTPPWLIHLRILMFCVPLLWIPIGMIYEIVVLAVVKIETPIFYYYLLLAAIWNVVTLMTYVLLATLLTLAVVRRRRQRRAKKNEQLSYLEKVSTMTLETVRNIWKNNFSGEFEGICPICIETIGDDDPLITLPCHHYFHRDCLSQAVSIGSSLTTCPSCRAPIKEDSGGTTATITPGQSLPAAAAAAASNV